SYDAWGKLSSIGSDLFEEYPMGRRDNRSSEVDLSYGGGEGDDDSILNGRITNVDSSKGWEVDNDTTLLE
ncbi:hypothetical protein KI387_030206, partial [Taxus chinensis]